MYYLSFYIGEIEDEVMWGGGLVLVYVFLFFLIESGD